MIDKYLNKITIFSKMTSFGGKLGGGGSTLWGKLGGNGRGGGE